MHMNCDSGDPWDVHLSNGLIQSCETCHTFTVEYAQVTVDRFCENTVFIPHLVTVYFVTLPFFLCLKR